MPKRKTAVVAGLVAKGFSARRACISLDLNRSTYLKHLHAEPSIRAIRRSIVADHVCLIHRKSGGTYGWRRIRAELLEEYEMIANRKLIMAVMVKHESAGVPRASAFGNPPADKRTDNDLVNRIFTADGPNRLWLTDVTENPTREAKSTVTPSWAAWPAPLSAAPSQPSTTPTWSM